MTTNSLVTVVLPVYNGERFVEKCITRLLKQTYKELEIIVVDDGSTDQTAEIIRQFPVTSIILEKNLGLSAARNRGMDKANGEFIHFMDVDDEINDDFYLELVSAVEETGASMACASMVNEMKDRRTIVYSETKVLQTVDEKFRITYVGRRGYVWRYLFRKSFLNDLHLRFEEGRFIEDMAFSMTAVYYAKSIVVVAKAKYFYKYNPDSIMKNKDKEFRKRRHKDGQHMKEFRKNFAHKHKIKIPGVPTSFFGHLYVKYLT